MTPSELARQNAIPLELKKDGLFQRQSGDWVLRFVVQATDMNEQIMKAAMGTRYQAALVEIGDDEQPAKEQPAPEPHSGRVGWKDMQPAAQCAIRLNDPVFMAFLRERYEVANEKELKEYLGVRSKTELSTKHLKRVIWHQLDQQFLAWKVMERT